MNTTTLAPQPGDSVAAFIQLMLAANAKLEEGAVMLARLYAERKEAVLREIHDAEPSLTMGVLRNLVRVGEGTLLPSLVFASGAAYKRLRSLPCTTQRQVMAEGALEVVIVGEVVRVPLAELLPEQVAQVFSADGLRTPDEQRAWLKREAMAASGEVTPEPFPWVFRKGRIIVHRDLELTKKDVLRMLEEFK